METLHQVSSATDVQDFTDCCMGQHIQFLYLLCIIILSIRLTVSSTVMHEYRVIHTAYYPAFQMIVICYYAGCAACKLTLECR